MTFLSGMATAIGLVVVALFLRDAVPDGQQALFFVLVFAVAGAIAFGAFMSWRGGD